MKTSKMQSIWIIIKSTITILLISIRTLFHATFCKFDRKKIDYLFRLMSTRLLQHIKLTYKIFDPYHLIFQPGRHYIVMCNHSSHYDIPLSCVAIPGSLRMLAKSELFRVPIWGRAMKAAEFLSIDRNNKEQARKDLATAKEKMQSGIILWVAPEGTRSRTGKLQSFKKGGFMLAYQTQAIIIPIGIRGSFNILPPKTTRFNLHEKVEVHIGKPIDVINYKITSRAKLMDDVRQSIAELSGQKIKEETDV